MCLMVGYECSSSNKSFDFSINDSNYDQLLYAFKETHE